MVAGLGCTGPWAAGMGSGIDETPSHEAPTMERQTRRHTAMPFLGRLMTAGAVVAAATIAPTTGIAAGQRLASVTSCPACGHNLILDPGAEAGPGSNEDTVVKVPDWQQTAASPRHSTPGPGATSRPLPPAPRTGARIISTGALRRPVDGDADDKAGRGRDSRGARHFRALGMAGRLLLPRRQCRGVHDLGERLRGVPGHGNSRAGNRGTAGRELGAAVPPCLGPGAGGYTDRCRQAGLLPHRWQ